MAKQNPPATGIQMPNLSNTPDSPADQKIPLTAAPTVTVKPAGPDTGHAPQNPPAIDTANPPADVEPNKVEQVRAVESINAAPAVDVKRLNGMPVIPTKKWEPDGFGQVLLDDPRAVRVLDSLTDTHDVQYDEPNPETKVSRISAQYNVFLTDGTFVIQAGLMHRDPEGYWIAQVYHGTRKTFPRDILGSPAEMMATHPAKRQ